MSWQQNIDADMNTGYEGGWCLKFVQDAYHTDHPYASATDAWDAEPNKHTDYPPAGKTVPIYLSLGDVPEGHVAIHLDDGYVASSTQPGFHSRPYFHPSLENLIATYAQYNGGATYLGWGEYVGSSQVIQWIDDAPVEAPAPIPAPVVVPDPVPTPVVEPPVVEPTPAPVEVPPAPSGIPVPETLPVTPPVVNPVTAPQPIVDPTPVPPRKNWLIAFIQKVIQFLVGYKFTK